MRMRKRWHALATALQNGQAVYLVGALFVGVGYQPFMFMLLGLQIAFYSLMQRDWVGQVKTNRPWLQNRSPEKCGRKRGQRSVIAPPIPPQRESTPHLAALTGLRGIAAWFVVFYHARLSLTEWMPQFAIAIAAKGYLAVDLFFMLSGFVMWLNYGPRLRAQGLAGAPAFWWRRLARIWPLHAAVLGALVVFALVLLVTGRDMANYPLAQLPLHVLLVQNWGLTPDLTWNHPAWSISAELGAYLLFPLAVAAVRWEAMRPLALLAGVGLAIAIAARRLCAGRCRDAGRTDTTAGAGALHHRVRHRHDVGQPVAGVAWTAGDGSRRDDDRRAGICCHVAGRSVAETLALPLAFAALLLALALDNGPASRLLSARPLVWLGDVSYATYLVHFPLLILLKLAVVGDDLQIAPGFFAAYLLVLLALSGALYRWWEQPAQSWLNSRMPKPAKPASA